METGNYTLSFLIDQTPDKVFDAITDVRNWWSGYYAEEIIGDTAKLNDEFTFRAGDGVHYTRHKLTEVIPGRKIEWLITESSLNLVEKKDEWTGTKVIFTIEKEGDKTRLTFTHEGLTPHAECFEACAPAWTMYLQNKLLPLINAAGDH
jgi:uncharacterized protein YndB with AHSA1/START domain